MDIVDDATRSKMMAAVRSWNTGPELQVRRSLHRRGFRFRLHAQDLHGRPDIVLSRWRVAIQVQGCFWHRHAGCRFATIPKTRPEFWATKFAANVERDVRNLCALRQEGWRVAIIWQCGLHSSREEGLLGNLEMWIRSGEEMVLELPQAPAPNQKNSEDKK